MEGGEAHTTATYDIIILLYSSCSFFLLLFLCFCFASFSIISVSLLPPSLVLELLSFGLSFWFLLVTRFSSLCFCIFGILGKQEIPLEWAVLVYLFLFFFFFNAYGLH